MPAYFQVQLVIFFLAIFPNLNWTKEISFSKYWIFLEFYLFIYGISNPYIILKKQNASFSFPSSLLVSCEFQHVM